jgi:uncharacterized protein
LVEWSVATAGYGLVGLLIGMALIPVSEYIVLPAWQGLHRLRESPAVRASRGEAGQRLD